MLLLCLGFIFPRLLTESKQEEFIQRAKILIRLEKYGDAVSVHKGTSMQFRPLTFKPFAIVNPPFFGPPSDLSVPVSDIPGAGRSGLLPHLRQAFPGLQCRSGVCRMDLLRRPCDTEDARQPHQKSQRPPAGQGGRGHAPTSAITWLNLFCPPPPPQIPNHTLARVFMCAAAAIAAFLFIQKSPVTYYVYCLLPVPVWYSVLKE